MAFFKKQRLHYQEWLNSFVVRHHDEWYMPLITIGLGIAYLILGLILLILGVVIIAGLPALFGTTWICIVAVVASLWGIGMFVRIPGDTAYDLKKSDDIW